MNAWFNFNTGSYAWQTSGSASNKLQERVSYDANGNITKYLRKGYSPINMDSLTYKYYPKSNKLLRVDDSVSVSTYADIDVDDQDSLNYEYDLTGNLVKDSIEGISLITWNLMGKVDSIARYSASSRPELKFLYDAMGNRVGKVVYDGADVTKTWYIRDAQGNIMATYEEQNDTLTWTEQHIYGSSRLGYWQPDSMMYPKPTPPATDTFRYVVRAGDKLYEISNHLGNVLASITDRKIPQETGTPNGIADYYLADIATVQDYYPFGMVMPGRNWVAGSAEGYGFGFNGKLKDDEIMSNSISYDFGARIYNAGIGRFLSIDPKYKNHPDMSNYTFAANQPIAMIDLEGKENVIYLVLTDNAKAQLSQADVQLIAEQANLYFETLGLATRVVIYDQTANGTFDMDYIDKTDAVAVLATTIEDAITFTKENLNKKTGKEMEEIYNNSPVKAALDQIIKTYGTIDKFIETDPDILANLTEGSFEPGDISINQVIALNISFVNSSIKLTESGETISDETGFLILHGKGHLAQDVAQHVPDSFMQDGAEYLEDYKNKAIECHDETLNTEASKKIAGDMKTAEGGSTAKSVDNYSKNKANN